MRNTVKVLSFSDGWNASTLKSPLFMCNTRPWRERLRAEHPHFHRGPPIRPGCSPEPGPRPEPKWHPSYHATLLHRCPEQFLKTSFRPHWTTVSPGARLPSRGLRRRPPPAGAWGGTGGPLSAPLRHHVTLRCTCNAKKRHIQDQFVPFPKGLKSYLKQEESFFLLFFFYLVGKFLFAMKGMTGLMSRRRGLESCRWSSALEAVAAKISLVRTNSTPAAAGGGSRAFSAGFHSHGKAW